jgi:hypothetical protein
VQQCSQRYFPDPAFFRKNSGKQRRTAALVAVISLLFFSERTRKARISAAKARAGRCKFWEKQQKTAGEPCAVVLG